jgi:general secretion pathway protein H
MKRGRAGFTLAELLVVMAILAMVSGLAMPLLARQFRAGEMQQAASQIAAILREARILAIGQNRRVMVEFNSATGTISLDGKAGRGQIPASLAATIVSARALRPGDTSQFFFLPDGGASGGSITLRGENEAMVINVNWVTGQVSQAAVALP